jgi:hypothetical protein
MKFESDPRKIEGELHKMSQDRVRFIPSRTIRSMIRHGRLDQLERFRINGVQAISVEGQETDRLGRIAWMVWTATLIVHVESDHGANAPPGRSHADLHEELHGGTATPPRPD